MTWTRGRKLPSDWNRRRRRILRRDGHRCVECGSSRFLEVDHIDNPDDHSDTNLRTLCSTCHKGKTARQAQQARGAGPTRRRPQEAHPGDVDLKVTTTQDVEGVGTDTEIDVDDDRAEWLLANGYVADPDRDDPDFGLTTSSTSAEKDPTLAVNREAPDEPSTEQPAKSAKVGEWRTYAGSLGLDTDGTKAELIERVEQHQAEA